jgi:intracellular sulfur oxidation DsrE/DsrF family protein
MKRHWISGMAFILLTSLCGRALAQSKQTLPIPGGQVATDIAGAKELPDPNMIYKVVFDIAGAAPKMDDVNPGLEGVARFVNTLAKNGVPADHRKIVVVLHQKSTEIVLTNEAFRARNNGYDNPNLTLIQSMKKAGVDFRVCGQAVLANKIDPKTIVPEIELDLWALTTMVNLELRGYVHVGGS